MDNLPKIQNSSYSKVATTFNTLNQEQWRNTHKDEQPVKNLSNPKNENKKRKGQ